MGWNLNYAGIARMWRGGCIIKSVFLGDITSAYQKNGQLESLLFDDFFNKAVHKAQPGWRRVVAQGIIWGIPVPAFSTALSFFDGYRSEVLPANLIQAQVRAGDQLQRVCPLITPYSVITSVPTPSASFPARRTPSSSLARTSVRTVTVSPLCEINDPFIDVNWTGRGGNVSASTYSA